MPGRRARPSPPRARRRVTRSPWAGRLLAAAVEVQERPAGAADARGCARGPPPPARGSSPSRGARPARSSPPRAAACGDRSPGPAAGRRPRPGGPPRAQLPARPRGHRSSRVPRSARGTTTSRPANGAGRRATYFDASPPRSLPDVDLSGAGEVGGHQPGDRVGVGDDERLPDDGVRRRCDRRRRRAAGTAWSAGTRRGCLGPRLHDEPRGGAVVDDVELMLHVAVRAQDERQRGLAGREPGQPLGREVVQPGQAVRTRDRHDAPVRQVDGGPTLRQMTLLAQGIAEVPGDPGIGAVVRRRDGDTSARGLGRHRGSSPSGTKSRSLQRAHSPCTETWAMSVRNP